MIPETGGFRVYARRAFGEGVGFAVGWVDWLCNVVFLALQAVTAVAFLGALWPPATVYPRALAIVILAAFTGAHWVGLRMCSSLTKIISTAVGLMLMSLVVGCFIAPPVTGPTTTLHTTTAASLPWMSVAMLFAAVPALRAVLTAYDGWYQPIYMAEENIDPARTLPRAIIGGALLVTALYLMINLAFLRVLPMSVLATSELPAADAARVALPRGGAEMVTVISLLTMLSLFNNNLLSAPRILLGIGRDGLFTEKAAIVSAGGTPRFALALTSVIVAVVILSGTFAQIVALIAVLFLVYYVSAFLAVFVLRHRDPAAPTVQSLWLPVLTAVVLVGSVAFLIAAVMEDPRSGIIAAVFFGAACRCIH